MKNTKGARRRSDPSCRQQHTGPTIAGILGREFWTSAMIRKLASGKYRLYSRKKNPKTGRRRNLGTFATRAAAVRHEQAVQFFKRR